MLDDDAEYVADYRGGKGRVIRRVEQEAGTVCKRK